MNQRAFRILPALALVASAVLPASAQEPAVQALSGHRDRVDCLSFSGDGKLLASAGADETVRVWETSTGKCRFTFTGHEDAILAVSFSPDGSLVASAGKDRRVNLWSTASGKRVRMLEGFDGEVPAVAFSPDGRELLVACLDGNVKGFDTTRWESTHSLWLRDPACCVAWSPDGKFYAVGDGGGVARVYDVTGASRPVKCAGHSEGLTSVAFSRGNTYLLTTSTDGSVRLWDPATGKKVRIVERDDHRPFNAVFNAEGTMFAASMGDDAIGLWETGTGNRLYRFKQHRGAVTCVACSADGRVMASGGEDRMVVIYSFAKETPKPEPPKPEPPRPEPPRPEPPGLDLRDTAKKQVADIALALKAFQADRGYLPHSLNRGMVNALSMGRGRSYYRFNRSELNDRGEVIDPWGHPLVYHSPGTKGAAFDLFSWGPDGKDDCGAGDDIGNW